MLSRKRAAAGFTLLEIVAAFAILALGLGMAMRGLTGALQQSRQAAEQTRAALHAQSVMDTLGVGERLEEGEYSGEFEDGYRWTVLVTPYEWAEDSEGPDFDPALSSLQLLHVDLRIHWRRGEGEAEARFSSLRAMQPAL